MRARTFLLSMLPLTSALLLGAALPRGSGCGTAPEAVALEPPPRTTEPAAPAVVEEQPEEPEEPDTLIIIGRGPKCDDAVTYWTDVAEPELISKIPRTPQLDEVQACLNRVTRSLDIWELKDQIQEVLSECAPDPIDGLGKLEADGVYNGYFCGTMGIQNQSYYVSASGRRVFSWHGMRGRECPEE